MTAAGGLCTGVGLAAVTGEHGPEALSLIVMLFSGAIALTWGAAGVGLLARWVGAWYVSLVLTGCTMLTGLVSALLNPCSAIYYCTLSCVILTVLIVRRAEFR